MNKQAHESCKRKDLILSAASVVVTTGGLAGTAVFLPAVAIGVCGIVLGVIAKKKNYARKIEMTRYAYTSYQKVLNTLRACLRGESYDSIFLIRDLHMLDDNIADLCPSVDDVKLGQKYEEIFDVGELQQKLKETESD